MTHNLNGCDNHGKFNEFTALDKRIGTSKSTKKDQDYVTEHSALKYFREKLACYLHDYCRHWFARFGLPPSNGRHYQLYESNIRRLMRRVQRQAGPKGGGRGRNRPKIQVLRVSSLDIGHKDFFG